MHCLADDDVETLHVTAAAEILAHAPASARTDETERKRARRREQASAYMHTFTHTRVHTCTHLLYSNTTLAYVDTHRIAHIVCRKHAQVR